MVWQANNCWSRKFTQIKFGLKYLLQLVLVMHAFTKILSKSLEPLPELPHKTVIWKNGLEIYVLYDMPNLIIRTYDDLYQCTHTYINTHKWIDILYQQHNPYRMFSLAVIQFSYKQYTYIVPYRASSRVDEGARSLSVPQSAPCRVRNCFPSIRLI